MDGYPFSEFLYLLDLFFGRPVFPTSRTSTFLFLFSFSEWARSTARKVTMSQALRIPTSRSSIIAKLTIYSAKDGFFGSINAARISKILARRGNAMYHDQSSNVD